MDWKPIETAPKDGTEILVCGFDYRGEPWREVARWGNWTYNAEKTWMAGPECGEHAFRHAVSPTLWQPLPELPSGS